MSTILVCGGRHFADYDWLGTILDRLAPLPTSIIHGGARGADSLAGLWAKARGVTCTVYPADWVRHGFAAGPKRNQQMLDEGQPGLVVAFPGGRGTADMVRRAKAAGVPVLRVGERAKEQTP